MSLEDNIDNISKILTDDGLLLCPSNNFWILCCNPASKVATARLLKLRKEQKLSSLYMVAASIKMLKKIIPAIHPRVETLLVYHQKPLVISYPEKIHSIPGIIEDSWRVGIPVKLVTNTFCSEIMDVIGYPLLAAYALDNMGNKCLDASEVDTSIKSTTDYITLDIYGDDQLEIEDVCASYDDSGNLIFQ